MKTTLILMLSACACLLPGQKDAYPLSGVAESGQFRLLVNDNEMAAIAYTLDVAGNYQRVGISRRQ